MIVFMRHAERGDNQIPQLLSEVEYDPPIIEAAKQTVQKAYQHISEILKRNGIKKYKVRCSKFLRCIMTMKQLEKHLKKDGYEGPSQYFLDDRVSQFLRDSWFPEFPIPNLIYKTDHLKKYVQSLSFTENNCELPFPENYPLFHNRVTELKKSLDFPEPDTCLIVMTHGFVVREVLFRMNQIPVFQNEVKYCGYTAYTEKNKIQTILKSNL